MNTLSFKTLLVCAVIVSALYCMEGDWEYPKKEKQVKEAYDPNLEEELKKAFEQYCNMTYTFANLFAKAEIHQKPEIFRAINKYIKNPTEEQLRTLDENSKNLEQTYLGLTPLVYAFSIEHWQLAKYFIQKGGQVNKKIDFDCKTPLHVAVIEGKDDIVKLLLEKGADVHLKDINDDTPLLCINSFHDNSEQYMLIAYQLIEAGASILEQGSYDNPFIDQFEDPIRQRMIDKAVEYAENFDHSQLPALLKLTESRCNK